MYLRPGKVLDVVSKNRRLFLFSPEDITSIRPSNLPPTKNRRTYIAPDQFLATATIG
jgi:hypothetical protein